MEVELQQKKTVNVQYKSLTPDQTKDATKAAERSENVNTFIENHPKIQQEAIKKPIEIRFPDGDIYIVEAIPNQKINYNTGQQTPTGKYSYSIIDKNSNFSVVINMEDKTYSGNFESNGKGMSFAKLGKDWELFGEGENGETIHYKLDNNLLKELDKSFESAVNCGNTFNETIRVAAAVPTLVAVPTAAATEVYGREDSETTGAGAVERQAQKAQETRDRILAAAIVEKSIRDEVERVLRELELEKMVYGDRQYLSAKDDKARERILEEHERSFAQIINYRFNEYVVPAIIDSSLKSREDKAAAKEALQKGTLVINEGVITKIPKNLQRLGPELKAMERQIGVAWETTKKMTVTKVDTYIQAQTKEAKKNVIENNLALDLTKGQREDISKEMTKYTKDEKVINGIKEGNLIALNRMDDRTLDKLYNIMLKIGTEKENEIISERIGDLDAKMGKEKLAKSIEDKAKEMRIELSDKDRELIRDIRKGGIAENKEKALSQISGIMFEVMRDSKIVEARRVEELPKVG